jgi:ATP-dependent RNA helicase HelY
VVLRGSELAAGDFVRWCKQVIDLLGQVQQAARESPGGGPLRRAAGDAVDRVRRGVVAYSSVV